jgi:predicted MFS family arabinose efflux permease
MSLLAILFLYREDESQNLAEPGDRRNKTESLKEIFSGISRVWKNRKIRIYFSLLAFFWILYAQIFSLIPLYLRFLDGKSPVELYIMILPITLLTFQLLISRFTEKWAPRRATITGMLLATLGILVNLIPAAFLKDPASKISLWGIDIPLGGLFILGSIMLLVTGEMILSPRMGHHLNSTGSGEAEGEAKGFANLPVVLGTVVGAPLGGILFEYFISLPRQTGQPARPVYIWSVLGILGLLSMLGMIRFHRSVLRETGAPD